jgi:hypothetical protein
MAWYNVRRPFFILICAKYVNNPVLPSPSHLLPPLPLPASCQPLRRRSSAPPLCPGSADKQEDLPPTLCPVSSTKQEVLHPFATGLTSTWRSRRRRYSSCLPPRTSSAPPLLLPRPPAPSTRGSHTFAASGLHHARSSTSDILSVPYLLFQGCFLIIVHAPPRCLSASIVGD